MYPPPNNQQGYQQFPQGTSPYQQQQTPGYQQQPVQGSFSSASQYSNQYQPPNQQQPTSQYQQQPTSQYQQQPTSQYQQQSAPNNSQYQSGYQQGSQYQSPQQQSPFQTSPPQQQQYQQPPPASSPYSAYPEYNPQSNVKTNFSYQNQRLAGWNEPPVASRFKINSQEILAKVKNPETVIVTDLTVILNSLKTRIDPSKQRMFDDCEKRIENLFEKLAGGLERDLLANCWLICELINKRDYVEAKNRVTDLMTIAVADTRWTLGLKRLIELLMQY